MENVFVKPQPKGRPEGAPITGYILELVGAAKAAQAEYKTQEEAIVADRRLGLKPLVACVRDANKRNPDHWRAA